MMGLQNQPLYRINTVCELTGLSPDAVRAWERRYGIPQPQRTTGRHRLYSRRDIRILKWLQARQAEGMRISKAVALWRSLSASGQDPFLMTEIGEEASQNKEQLDALRADWLRACLDFNEVKTEQVLDTAFAEHDVERVATQVLQRGLHDMGDLWYRNLVSVQQEHFASELAMRRLHTLLAGCPPPRQRQTAVVVMPAGEQHSFATTLLTFFLRRRGWHVMHLGGDVPLEYLPQTLNDIRPDILILAAQVLFNVPSLKSAAEVAMEAGIPVGYGGGIFNTIPSLRQHIPGYFLGQTLLDALDGAPALAGAAIPAVKTPSLPPGYAATLQSLRQAQGAIDAAVQTALAPTPMPQGALTTALDFTSKHIQAALTLGNLDLALSQVAWVRGLLTHRHIDADLLDRFWKAYRDTVRRHLHEQSDLIVDWLTTNVLEQQS